MAENKTLTIGAKIDSTQFDAQIKSLEEKMRNLQKGVTSKNATNETLKNDPVFGATTKKALEDAQKMSNDFLQTQYRQQQEIFKQCEKRNIQIKETIKLEKELGEYTKNNGKTYGNELRQNSSNQRMALAQAEIIKNRMPPGMYEKMMAPPMSKGGWQYGKETNQGYYNNNQKSIGGSGAGGASGGSGSGGAGAGAGGEGAAEGGMSAITGILKALGVASIMKGVMNATLKFVEHKIDRDTKALSDRAGAAATAAQGFHESVAGRGGSQFFWASERKSALQMATDRQSNVSDLDLAKSFANPLLKGAEYATMGGMAGGIYGGIAGFGVGAISSIMGNKRGYNRLFDSAAYNAMASKEGMQNYEANLLAQQSLTPDKGLAEKKYDSEYSQQILTGRSLGLNTEGLLGKPQRKRGYQGPLETQGFSGSGAQGYGNVEAIDYNPFPQKVKPEAPGSEGYLMQGLDQFSPETMARQAAGLKAAGASTEMMKEGRVRSATYERQFNLENSGALFGMQGAVGLNTQQSEQNIKKVLSDAMTSGINKSNMGDMAQELQKFTQVAVEMATSSGGFSPTAAAQLAGAISGPMNSFSIESAKSAAQQFQDKAGSTEGMEGQMNQAFVMKKFGHGLGSGMQNLLTATTSKTIESDPQLLQDIAMSHFGGDKEATKKFFKDKDANAQNKSKRLDMAEQALDAYNAKGIVEDTVDKQRIGGAIRNEARSALASESNVSNYVSEQLNAKLGLGGKALNRRLGGEETNPFIDQMLNMNKDPAARAKEAALGMGEKTGLKAERDYMGDLTKASQKFNENAYLAIESFTSFRTAIMTGATGLNVFTDSVLKLQKALNSTSSAPKIPLTGPPSPFKKQ